MYEQVIRKDNYEAIWGVQIEQIQDETNQEISLKDFDEVQVTQEEHVIPHKKEIEELMEAHSSEGKSKLPSIEGKISAPCTLR